MNFRGVIRAGLAQFGYNATRISNGFQIQNSDGSGLRLSRLRQKRFMNDSVETLLRDKTRKLGKPPLPAESSKWRP